MKNVLKIFIIIVTIFFSYSYLQTMGKGFHDLDANDYTLRTYNINKDNKWAAFKDKYNGQFFIHPGEIKTSKGIFIFKNDYDLIFNFSIEESFTSGEIGFIVKKNNKIVDRFNITLDNPKKMNLHVLPDDKIEIIADKMGSTSNDHGKLDIDIEGAQLELQNFLIPFLWSLFFIFLFGKHYTYLAFNSYIIFLFIIFSERLNFGPLSITDLITYMLIMFSLTFVFVLIYQELVILKKFKVASIFSFVLTFIVYIIPLFFIIYALNFDSHVTKDILYAVFQSNLGESYEYISDFISIKYILLLVIMTFIIGVILFKQEKKEIQKLEKSLLFFMIITYFSIAVLQFKELKLPEFILTSLEKYTHELTLFKETQQKRQTGKIKFEANKKGKGETYIIIIGESLNKNHMGIYGYLRNTTPHLSDMNKDAELMVFNNVYSNHVHTVPVLSFALTEANQYNDKKFFDSLSIVDILKKADIDTYWFTNQTIYGSWDNMVSVIATSSDHIIAHNKSIGAQLKTQQYDAVLIDDVKKVLEKKTDKNRVIFIHLYGNHQMYDERYPRKTYTIFSKKLKKDVFGIKAFKNSHNVNIYDNSVLYNDYVVSEILKILQKKNGVSGFLYFSDHADDVVNHLAHTIDKFTFQMTQIPMIGWLSNAYQKKYAQQYKTLSEHKNTLFSNDMLYDTMLGIFQIQSDKYNAHYDLSSKKYSLKEKDALVNHGKKHYSDTKNYIYWQRHNLKYLQKTNQSTRVIPEKVDTVGKLRDLWNDGFRSFSVDIYFNHNKTFSIGKRIDKDALTLDTFLSYIEFEKIEKIKLNLTNFNINNYKQVLNRLALLENKFNIKNKAFIEVSNTLDLCGELYQAGWKTSYVLSGNTIVNLQKNKFRETFFSKIKLQNISIFSFHKKDYDNVNKYLEAYVDSNTTYIVLGTLDFKDKYFKAKLTSDDCYKDQRVQLMTVKYRSQFTK